MNIPVHLIFGRYDAIIPFERGESFVRELPNAKLHLLDEGHRLVNDKLCELMKSGVILTNPSDCQH